MSPSAGSGGGTGSRAPQEARGKVVWSATMSLDGLIAGPDDAMGWVSDYFWTGWLAGPALAIVAAALPSWPRRSAKLSEPGGALR